MANLKISELTYTASPGTDALLEVTIDPAGTPATRSTAVGDLFSTIPVVMSVALSDEASVISAAENVVAMRAPWAFTLTAVKTTLSTASTLGVVTVDVKEAGTTVLSTKPTIDVNEKTSATGTAAVVSDSAIADDAEITFDIDAAGAGAKGLKVWLYGTRNV